MVVYGLQALLAMIGRLQLEPILIVSRLLLISLALAPQMPAHQMVQIIDGMATPSAAWQTSYI